jgi:hypothetical protein
MKRTRSVAQAIESAKPIPQVTLAGEPESVVPLESNLSPERMIEGASVTTALLNEILAQREGLHQPRGWGINE